MFPLYILYFNFISQKFHVTKIGPSKKRSAGCIPRLGKTPYGSFVARALLRDDRVNREGAMRLFKSLDPTKMGGFQRLKNWNILELLGFHRTMKT